jgi:hypothetical protein
MNRKFKDFTQFVEERRKISPTFTIFGNTYTLAPTLPYDAVLRFQALQMRNASDELSADDMFALFESMVGKDTVDDLRKYAEFDVETMTEILKYAFEVYGVRNEESEDETKPNPKGANQKRAR